VSRFTTEPRRAWRDTVSSVGEVPIVRRDGGQDEIRGSRAKGSRKIKTPGDTKPFTQTPEPSNPILFVDYSSILLFLTLTQPLTLMVLLWCLRSGSNRHGVKHRGILSPLRLPIPPLRPAMSDALRFHVITFVAACQYDPAVSCAHVGDMLVFGDTTVFDLSRVQGYASIIPIKL
jgi:hypothetical protein